MRPPSILRFERLYLAAFGLNLIGWFLAWPQMAATLARNPATARATWVLPLGLALSALVTLVLWRAVARGGSNVARWAVVVLAVLAVARLLLNVPALLAGQLNVEAAVLAVVATLLQAGAAATLFADDARAWFTRGDEEDVG